MRVKIQRGRAITVGLLAMVVSMGALAQVDSSAAVDEISLINGSRILGKVTGTRDGVITIDTEFAGTLSVRQNQVAALRTREPMVMKLANGAVVEQPITVVDQRLQLSSPAEGRRSYAIQDLQLVNPQPWELGEGYRWTGLASIAVDLQRGNTQINQLDYKAESVWRSTRDRYTWRLLGEIDETNDVENANHWTATAKYDRFLEGPWYWGVNAVADHDKFADLDLRSYVGPYVGRQFYQAPALTLSAELGLAYVVEDFIVAEDEEYPAANWYVNMSSDYLGGESRLYLDHAGIWNLEEPSKLVFNTTFGLAFPLMESIEAAAEILLDYDNGVPLGIKKLDQTYSFRLGYRW